MEAISSFVRYHLYFCKFEILVPAFLIVHDFLSKCSMLVTYFVADQNMFVLIVFVDCRENEQLSKYGDTKTARSIMLIELKKLIEANPLFREKLVFPTLKASRLRTLINQRFDGLELPALVAIFYHHMN